MDMTLGVNCEFYRECPLFDPELEKMGADDKAGWQITCYYKKHCENAINMFLQKQVKEADQKYHARYEPLYAPFDFNFVKDSREKQ